jgi:hypothetical protein
MYPSSFEGIHVNVIPGQGEITPGMQVALEVIHGDSDTRRAHVAPQSLGVADVGAVMENIQPGTSGADKFAYRWVVVDEWGRQAGILSLADQVKARWDSTGVSTGPYRALLHVTRNEEKFTLEKDFVVTKGPYGPYDDVPVTLRRSGVIRTEDIILWGVIRHGTEAVSFRRYKDFIDSVMCGSDQLVHEKLRMPGGQSREFRSSLPFPGVDAYNLLKTATEVFLMGHVGVNLNKDDLSAGDLADESIRLGEEITRAEADRLLNRYLRRFTISDGETEEVRTLPYLALIADKLRDVGLKPAIGGPDSAANCYGILMEKLRRPCMLELIWSYWQEEGMLVQTMNSISLRFQNRRTTAEGDPLARLDIDPLRPLGNLLWGYIQDEQHRLSVVRRAYEYDHHYGITLVGKAVRDFRPADSRSKFLEGFHNLLHLISVFYTQDDDTTVIADGFPLLNAIREVHLVLAEGAHNQFGDLPSTARQEMLIQQWLLARPEMREFLGGRIMVPYPEPWMDRVDTVKKMYSWTDTIVTHFHELAIYGERLLLSIRYGNWSNVDASAAQAANWARYWRPEVQGYIHAYRAATGVELAPTDVRYSGAATGRAVQPSVLLQKRLAVQNRAR